MSIVPVIIALQGSGEPQLPTSYIFETLNSSTEFSPMDGNGLVSYNGKLLNMGGWFGSTQSHSQLWESTDGINWTQLPDAPWHKRHTYGHGVKDGKIWVWGGDLFYNGLVPKDVWTYDGVWSQVTNNWGLIAGERVLFAWANDNTHIYMAGGQTDYSNTPTMFTDVVRSADGIIWEKVCDLPISYFSTGSMVIKDNKLIIMSGGRYRNNGHDNYNTAVWEYDLSQGLLGLWTKLAEIPLIKSMYANSYVWDNKIWHLMGAIGSNQKGLRYSSDGSLWNSLSDAPSARHATGITVHNNALHIVAGNLHNDSYKISK